MKENLRQASTFLLVCVFALAAGTARANTMTKARARTSASSRADSHSAAHASAHAVRRAPHASTSRPAASKPAATPAIKASAAAASSKELESFARELKGKNPNAAYGRLSGIANAKSGATSARAALALGYYDYSRDRYPDAMRWLNLAKRDSMLGDYVLYWTGETELAQQRSADALAAFQQIRKSYPSSVMTEQALQGLGEAAIALNQPAAAIAALDEYSPTPDRPALLFLRGEAHERAGEPIQAAADYEAVYTRYPLSESAKEAGVKFEFLRGSMSDQIPAISMAARLNHADAIFTAKQWTDARSEYAQLLPQLSGAQHERAEVRIMECGIALGAGITELAALQVSDPDVDAERFYTLADYYRAQQQDTQLNQAVDAAATRAPSSQWTDNALFLAGNYYWVKLDRDQASSYYHREEQQFPTSIHAAPAQWRVAWTAVLKRAPNSMDLLIEHLRRFSGSAFTADALYWLGRLSEEAGDNDLARSYYAKLNERYPGSFFDMAAAQRTPRTDPGPTPPVDVLALVPPIPAAAAVGSATPAAASERQARADALRSIAFDSSAELELRAAYAATSEPRFLVEAAQADVAAQKYGAAIVTLRQVYPQLEFRPYSSVPRDVWLAAYPLPHETPIRHWANYNGLDPYLVAGLARQESAFDPNARSPKNAMGVMQILPEAGRLWAKDQRIRFSQPRLFDPDYNIRLGTAYFSALKKQFGSAEAALAAYNAGEDRVALWTATPYRDIPEFVDSIPFTETRDYVEIITRNAGIYHRIYAAPAASATPEKPAHKTRAHKAKKKS